MHNTLEYNREINQSKDDGRVEKQVFSPDTKIVANISDYGITKLLNLQTGTITTLKHNKKVNNVVFSPDGNTVATVNSGGNYGTVNLWNLKGNVIGTFQHQGLLQIITRLEFSPDGQTIATALVDGTVHLSNLQGTKIAILTHYRGALNLAFSPDGMKGK